MSNPETIKGQISGHAIDYISFIVNVPNPVSIKIGSIALTINSTFLGAVLYYANTTSGAISLDNEFNLFIDSQQLDSLEELMMVLKLI